MKIKAVKNVKPIILKVSFTVILFISLIVMKTKITIQANIKFSEKVTKKRSFKVTTRLKMKTNGCKTM